MKQQNTNPMKSTSNAARYVKASKLQLVFWIILASLLFFRTLAAQGIAPHRQKRNGGFTAVQRDSTRRPAGDKSYWFDIGLGWGGQGNAFDIGFSYEVSPQRIMSLRCSNVRTSERFHDYFLYLPIANYPSGEDAFAVDLTYGFLKKGKAGMINFSAGLSFVRVHSGTSDGASSGYDIIIISSDVPADYQLEKTGTVGLVLRAQIMPSFRWGGLGISPSVNINPEYTFASVTIQLALGKMRGKVRRGGLSRG